MDYSQSPQVSVLEPIGSAIEKTKQILFAPFDITKWFTIGFCAWLTTLGGGGGGGGGGYNYPSESGGARSIQHELTNLKDTVLENLPIILPIAMVVILIIVTLTLVFMWLRSRGQFMFLDCVARNVGQVVNPWKQYARHANSLFLFNIVLGLIGTLTSLLFIVPLIFIVISFAESDFQIFLPASVISGVFLFLGFIGLCLLFAVIKTLTKDFVVPVMYVRNCSVTDGWRHFWALCSLHKGLFFLYLLFLLVIKLAIGTIVFMLVLVTCCCAACILAIPYIGTVLFLPVLVWRRAYSALFLAQFGPDYNVFPESEPVVVVPSASVLPIGSDDELSSQEGI